MPESLLDLPVRDLLDAVADHTPAPGGGAVAALAAAFAAALTGMAARYAAEPGESPAAADELRARVAPLADADASAFTAYSAALRMPRDAEGRPAAVERARDAAAAVPAEVAEVAHQVAVLADELRRSGNPHLASDAAAAVALAAAAASIAAGMVAVNTPKDAATPRLRRAEELAATTRALTVAGAAL
jgi:methenyltetrahydrofolate cyclohydrolase